jgi:hypothetical protein
MSTAASLPSPQKKLRGFSRVWRTLRQLFHEVVAALFAVLAFIWSNAAVRAWKRDAAHWLIAIAGGVAAGFLIFAITSFRAARKI